MPSPQLARILAALRARGANRDQLSVAESRAGFENIQRLCPPAADVAVEPVAVGGVPCEWLRAPGADAGASLLYLHGGAYVLGSLGTHRDLASRLGRAAQARVLNVGYRLAPEHPFPAALDDALAVYERTVVADGGGGWAIGGDSAGGGLTLACLLAARDRGLPLPQACFALSPSVDLAGEAPSMTTRAGSDPVIQKRFLELTARLYLGEGDRRDPLASPLYGELRGLPPLFVQVGGLETLLDDSTRLAARAREAGVEVELKLWPEMFHGWQLYARLLPEGEAAIAEVGEFLRLRLTRGAAAGSPDPASSRGRGGARGPAPPPA